MKEELMSTFTFYFHSRRSRPPSWAVTSPQTTNTLWQDPVTRRPPSMRSSTRDKGGSCSATALLIRWLLLLLPLDHRSVDYNGLRRTTCLENLTGGNRWSCLPKDACAGKKLTFFLSFFVSKGLFLGYTFFVTSEFFSFSLRIFGCNPMKPCFISENLVPRTSCEKCTYWIK